MQRSIEAGTLRQARQAAPWAAALAVVAGLCFFFPYSTGYGDRRVSMFSMLWAQWMHSPDGEWQHGVLVPFIALFLAWRERTRLFGTALRPANGGLAVLVFALLSYYLGYATDLSYFGYAGLQLLIAGIVVWFAGWAALRVVLFPWLFLVFMYPLPFLDDMIATPLRRVMAQSAHLVLLLLGVDNVRSGTALVSTPNFLLGIPAGSRFAIDVADPCSGIRSLFALLMISALYGWFTLRQPWQRWVLFAAAVPLALAGNVCRLVMLTFGTIWWGAGFAVGTLDHPTWFHLGAGYFVFAVALGGMVGVCRLLEKRDLRAAGSPA